VKEEIQNFSAWADDPEAFRQQVRMAAVQVAGLRPEELAQALAYEVEPFSGIPATEAEVGFKTIADPDPSVRVYDVAVRRRKRRGASSGGLDRWLKPAVIFACVVGALMVADGIFLACRKSSLAKSVAERRPLQTQLDRMRREAKSTRDGAAAIRLRREAVIRAQDEAANLRMAHADLLEELAAACGERAVVSTVSPGEAARTLHVRAIGVSAEAAAEVMRLLTERASAKGWRVVPGTITASGTGATVTFGLEVVRSE